MSPFAIEVVMESGKCAYTVTVQRDQNGYRLMAPGNGVMEDSYDQ